MKYRDKKNVKELFIPFIGFILLVFLMPIQAGAQDDSLFTVKKMTWKQNKKIFKLKGIYSGGRQYITITDSSTGLVIGKVKSKKDGKFRFKTFIQDNPPCNVKIENQYGEAVWAEYTRRKPAFCDSEWKEIPNEPSEDDDAEESPEEDSAVMTSADVSVEEETAVDTPVFSEDTREETAAAAANSSNSSQTAQGSHAGRFSSYEGTQTCLVCHDTQAYEVHASVHYQWRGNAAETTGLTTSEAGKMGGINDFCIYPDINWIGKLNTVSGQEVDGGCAKCHAGLGQKPDPMPTSEQLENIDCLICHSDEYRRKVEKVDGVFRFVPDEAAMNVSIFEAAADVQKPSSDACLNCHTKAGGGNNYKRGDIEEAHRNASIDLDVHMASKAKDGAGLNCLDCHTVTAHRFSGRGSDLRPRESYDIVSCGKCHSERPHHDDKLDKHTGRVNCTVCHIPYFAKNAPTDMMRDWSKPGDLDPDRGLYEPHHTKGEQVQPEYRFWNGSSYFYEFGSPAQPGPDGKVVMSAPEGSIEEPGARIYAFKHHLGNQPADPETGRLLPLKIGKFFESGQIDEAVRLGAEAAGWNYNGHTFVETERWMGLFHEVAPKEQALSCKACHEGGNRLDFKALGYTPKTERSGRPLCASCHKDKSREWRGSEYFKKVHEKHVNDKKLDCITCHVFAKAD